MPCLLQGPGAETEAGGIQTEIPSCISVFRLKYHCISRLLVLVAGGDGTRGGGSGEEQGSVPSCPTGGRGCSCPAAHHPCECSPKHTYCLLAEFWLALHPPSLCPWLLATFIYLLAVVYFSCQTQGFQPKPREGWSSPALREVSAGVKGVQGQAGNEVNNDLNCQICIS